MRAIRAFGFGTLVAASACGPRTLAPEPIPLDRAHCARCDMIISDARNAAQAVSPSDDTRFYDDIGCLARDRAARAKGLRLFVRDGAADGWLPVEQAFFARPAGLETPMGYGITAFASEAAARRADRDGTARHWPDVVREAEAAR